jgi:hypothetical protein
MNIMNLNIGNAADLALPGQVRDAHEHIRPRGGREDT